MKNPKPTPIDTARGIRQLFRTSIPKTWEELRQRGPFADTLTAYSAAQMVLEQSGCSFEDAAQAVQQAIPELFADYWENLPKEVI